MKVKLCLLVLCAVVYNSNGQAIPSGDTRPASLIPFSILLEGRTSLDRFFESQIGGAEGLQRMTRQERSRFYYVAAHRGRLHSNYPVTTPVLITPLYVPLVLFAGDWTTERIVRTAPIAEKIVASLIAALSVVLMYILLSSLAPKKWALILALAFAFGTSMWTTSSQALWQHGPGAAFIILTLLALARRPDALWLAGLAAGMAAAVRPSNVLLVLTVMAVTGIQRRSVRSALVVGCVAASVVFPVLLYNQFIYGDPRGGYAITYQAFRAFLPEGLAGVLISPSRGLLVYTPFLVFGFVGSYLALRRKVTRYPEVYLVAAIFALWHIVFFGWWKMWWGGWSYGPRLLTEAATALVVLCVPAIERFESRRWINTTFTVLLLYSVSVQVIGALAYGGPGWNGTPVSVDANPRRLWDLRDHQLGRTTERLIGGEWVDGCRDLKEWLTLRCYMRSLPP